MQILCLDLEGVLVPEIWIAFAEETGVEALKRTTRDEPDYDALMRYRLEILNQHGFTLSQIQEVIATLAPSSRMLKGCPPASSHRSEDSGLRQENRK